MKKKKPNWFLRILMVLFIIFIGLFIAGESGYYEAKINKSVSLTTESIRQFEEDVVNGKEVDIKKYIESDDRDYSNGLTKAGDKISDVVVELFSGGLTNIWDVVKVLFT